MLKTDFPPWAQQSVFCSNLKMFSCYFFHFIRKAFTLKLFSSTDPLFCEGFYIETCTILAVYLKPQTDVIYTVKPTDSQKLI